MCCISQSGKCVLHTAVPFYTLRHTLATEDMRAAENEAEKRRSAAKAREEEALEAEAAAKAAGTGGKGSESMRRRVRMEGDGGGGASGRVVSKPYLCGCCWLRGSCSLVAAAAWWQLHAHLTSQHIAAVAAFRACP